MQVWSRTGMLRSSIVKAGAPVYCVVWGPDNDQLLICSGRECIIKTVSNMEKKEVKCGENALSTLVKFYISMQR